jgi:acetyl esterase
MKRAKSLSRARLLLLAIVRVCMSICDPFIVFFTARRMRFRTLRYGRDRVERLHHILPSAPVGNRAPVVYIHGGGWILGTAEFWLPYLGFLPRSGYRVFNLNYPLAPAHPHPAPLISCLGALAWIKANLPDSERVHLMGDSVGGNLAMMMGILLANPELLDDVDPRARKLDLPEISSVVSIYGVLERLAWIRNGFRYADFMVECYGGSEALDRVVGPDRAITPMDVAFERVPRCLLVSASRDPLAEATHQCLRKIEKISGDVTHKEYLGERHSFFQMLWRENSALLRRDILEFLDSPE